MALLCGWQRHFAGGSKRILVAAQHSDVSVVVTTFNDAGFLRDALDSLTRQTLTPDRIIVVDDGSREDPSPIAGEYAGVTLIRTANQGLAAARNEGLDRVTSRYVMFLDADDCLVEDAIETSRACIEANPGAGFAYGAFQLVDRDLVPLGDPVIARVGPRSHLALLRQNLVIMHGAVIYDRKKLVECGGFASELRLCEDYDVYLRMSKRYRVASHTNLVASYRMHSSNISRNTAELNFWYGKVRDRNRPPDGDAQAIKAWRAGERREFRSFANFAWKQLDAKGSGNWSQRMQMLRRAPVATLIAVIRQIVIRLLPRSLVDWLRRVKRRLFWPGPKVIDFGDLLRVNPISKNWGYARGTPVDRIYIESFLQRHAADIAGRVLETGDAGYAERFASPGDGLDISRRQGVDEPLAAERFDCIILAQTLQYAADLEAAVARLEHALRPGGVVLATMPCIGPLFEKEGEAWKWLFTPRLAREIFDSAFGDSNVEVSLFGNAFAATCFLQGVAAEEVGEDWLEPGDPDYPLIVAVRACKRPAGAETDR
jgi:glycosyltransferase involved in cell wall biosynthesis